MRKKFILALQPHEATPTRRAWSPMRTTLSFCAVLILLMGLAFPLNLLEINLAAVKKGLTEVALGQKLCKYMPMSDARELLKEWYGETIVCTEPTEQMWKSYCQQFYISEGGDCGAVSAEMKATVMNNMRICKVSSG